MNTDDTTTLTRGTPTVADALAWFSEVFAQRVARGGRSPATLAMHQGHARQLARALPPSLELAQVSPRHVDQVVAAAGPDISGSTIRKRLATLYGAFRVALRRGALRELPARPDVDYVYRPSTAHLRSVDELRRLCARLPCSRAEWVIAAVYTGMHAGDLNTWRAWLDCDPFAGWMVLYNRKNRTTPIRVRMPAELARVLRGRFTSARLEPGHLALRTWDHATRGHQLRAAAAAAGVDAPNATALRHTCGTWIVRRRGITPAAARWLGHKSTAMLERVYAHALPLQLEELTDELDLMELDGAARLAPSRVSRKRAGNPRPSTVDGSGPGGARHTAGPGKRRRGTSATRGSDHSDFRRGLPVPRDRVELSTHGFSVDVFAGPDLRAAAAPSVASKREGPPPWPITQQHRHRHRHKASASS